MARFAPRGSVRLGVSFQVVNGSVESGGSGAGGAYEASDLRPSVVVVTIIYLHYVTYDEHLHLHLPLS